MDVREISTGRTIEPRERVLLMLPDGLVNIFRTFVVGVMEAVYVSGLPLQRHDPPHFPADVPRLLPLPASHRRT